MLPATAFIAALKKGKEMEIRQSENVSIWLEWKCWKDSRKHRICPQTHKLSPETSYGFLNRARRTKPVIIQQPTRVWRHNWYTRALVTWHAYSCVPGDSRKSFCRQFFFLPFALLKQKNAKTCSPNVNVTWTKRSLVIGVSDFRSRAESM